MAGQPYEPPYRPAPEVVQQIDYEAHGKIRFDPDRALFGPDGTGTASAYPATFFHLGQFFGNSSSDQRRVGKECFCTFISRWSPYHYKTYLSIVLLCLLFFFFLLIFLIY